MIIYDQMYMLCYAIQMEWLWNERMNEEEQAKQFTSELCESKKFT